MLFIFFTLLVWNLETSIELNNKQFANILFISITFSVLKLETSIEVNDKQFEKKELIS